MRLLFSMRSRAAFISVAIAFVTLAAFGSAAPAQTPEPPVPKYFHEDAHDPHYDDRFAPHFYLKDEEREKVIRILVQTYLATFQQLGVQTWLMHGSLLGWWWGKKIMPWDFDADMQINEADIYFLAAYYNMTVYYYKYGNMKEGRFFQLEVNLYFTVRDEDDRLNVVDARWIDMKSGLFIDITAARYALNHKEGEGILFDKFGHEYRDTYIFPLRDTVFEGVPAKIPFRYKDVLRSEYGQKALSNTEYHGHRFDEDDMKWVLVEEEKLVAKS